MSLGSVEKKKPLKWKTAVVSAVKHRRPLDTHDTAGSRHRGRPTRSLPQGGRRRVRRVSRQAETPEGRGGGEKPSAVRRRVQGSRGGPECPAPFPWSKVGVSSRCDLAFDVKEGGKGRGGGGLNGWCSSGGVGVGTFCFVLFESII